MNRNPRAVQTTAPEIKTEIRAALIEHGEPAPVQAAQVAA